MAGFFRIDSFFQRLRRAYYCQSKRICSSILSWLPPDVYFCFPKVVTGLWYASQKGFFPKFAHPRDINEQLMVNNIGAFRNPNKRALLIRCADKFTVRDYVKERGLGDILNDCYGAYDSINDIDFDAFPHQFVLKTTNGSGQIIICHDKSRFEPCSVKAILNKWLSEASVFGLKTGEWHYSAIKPRIIAEKFLDAGPSESSLIDYKFHCIHGKVVGVLVCYDRNPSMHELNLDHFDMNWQLTECILPQFHRKRRLIPRPASFEQMCRVSEVLSQGIDYVRVDLYDVNGEVFFGEMTFTPAANLMTYYTQDFLNEMLSIYKSGVE